jgi:transposase
MRKSYNGLSALVKNKLQGNPLSGELFVFVNRRQNQMKILLRIPDQRDHPFRFIVTAQSGRS